METDLVKLMQALIDVAEGRAPADLVFVNASIVDVYRLRVARGQVALCPVSAADLMPNLQGPALGASFGTGRHKDFHMRARANHRANVTAIQHSAIGPGGKGALHVGEGDAHRRNGRNHRGGFAHLGAAQY